MSDNIKVVVKVRPLIPRESEDGLSYQWRVKNNVALYQLDQSGRELGVCFTFDKVYDKDTRTSDIYNDVAKPIVEAATAGFNGTIFAYGQTSSGKTYTMSGTEESPGIIPLAVKDLFQTIKNIPDRDFLVRVSYIEIYNETLIDLLNLEKKNIKVKENFQGVKVDCTEIVTSSPEEVLKFLKQGEVNRQTGPTRMNEESSRSHSIFQITIESRDHIEGEEPVGCVNVSTLNLVDLAGSERAGQTGATGIRFKEGTHINKSLSTLALVIKQLSEGQTKYINYRDSKLTRILQNSLGGNAKTSIICAVTPAAVDETISTLQFASRAKAIKNKPEVNAVATNATMIQDLTKQLSKLQSQLESKKNLEVMLESRKHVEQDLQNQIAALQRLILNGFVQRSSIDMTSGTRRKLVQPRRVTISTLHPIEEDPVSILPKFNTPLLKYNPMSLPNNTDFVPIQNNKLCSVSEEKECRLVTPPPQERKKFNDEIIDLDSDDANNSSETQICSPYHKCRVTSETPPCILRKNAKLAEKNYNDIVELTEREKIYTPEVIELIKKLEETSSVKTRLQEEVTSLDKTCKEKDLHIEQLKVKVTKSKEEIESVNSAKSKLEKLCDEYTIKLTEWEVSYENLQKKTKKREEELLSLLEEQKPPKKCESFNKPTMHTQERELNFMDMSKDISLVNSDNECSILNVNDCETPNHFQEMMSELQNQLTLKSNTILKIEEELIAGNLKIKTLESSCLSLQNVIDQLNHKMSMLENENSLLKSTMDTLNNTIQSQKANLESARVDMESYNILIQELQIKLANKEKILNLDINEDVLENMIANEEKFLANNDNMKNIITSFKLAINNKNKELESLQAINSTNLVDNNRLKDQVIERDEEINKLNDGIKSLQNQINDNIVTINKLIQDNNNLTDAEQSISSELRSVNENIQILENINQQNKIKLKQKEIEQLSIISEKTEIERNLSVANENLNRKVTDLKVKIVKLEEEVSIKDGEIISLRKDDIDLKDQISKAKSFIKNLINTITSVLGDLPDHYKNYLDFENVSNDMFVYMESKLNDLISQRDLELENNIKLKKELQLCYDNHCKESQIQIDLLTKSQQEHVVCKNIIEGITKERDEISDKFQIQNSELNDIKTNLIDSQEHNKKLESDLLNREQTINDLKEKESLLSTQIETTILEVNKKIDKDTKRNFEIETELDTKISLLSEKDKIINELRENLGKLNNTLDEKVSEICILNNKIKDIIENYKTQLNRILHEVTKTFNLLNINSTTDEDASTYEVIYKMANQITDYVASLKYQKSEENSIIDEMLSDAKKEISQLTIQNKALLDKLYSFETYNEKLVSELEDIKVENVSINKDLVKANDDLQSIKNSLKEKSLQLEHMVTKAQGLNEHFTDWNIVVKDQLAQLKSENEILKNRLLNHGNNGDGQSYKFSDTMSDDIQTMHSSGFNTHRQVIKSPSSLATICCHHIIKALQPSEKSVSTTNSNISIDHCSNSDYKDTELKSAQSEIITLSKVIEELRLRNQELITEREEVHKEVQLLLEPAYELQMKISNHKTNLSILTATTYAENKSLNSHIKGLQHYHKKFYNACQKDIPGLKKQLFELQTILKSDSLCIDKHNSSFKRFSLPCILDSNSSMNGLKNDSTLDGDLLMLDNNLTLTTLDDNTMIGVDQTCLDVTQVCPNIDVACQTNEDINADFLNVDQENMLLFEIENKKMHEKINILEQNNKELKEQIDKYLSVDDSRQNDDIMSEIERLSNDLIDVKRSKEEIEIKYNNVMLEVPSMDALVCKLNTLEKEYNNKLQDISKLTNILNEKNLQLKLLQQENDSLSTQVMENITETDELNKALEDFKESNAQLSEKCLKLEKLLEESKRNENHTALSSSQCLMKDKIMQGQQNVELHSKLNRSLSDSDTSSRYNKICTLQKELHAGREDCKELSEDVVTIKNHLDRSNISMEQNMELDDSIADTNIFNYDKNFEVNTDLNKLNIQQDHLDMYTLEKNDCLIYYIEKTEMDKENLSCDIKIIDLMKMFYNDIVTKHNNQIENLVNKIKCYEESRSSLETHVNDISNKYSILKITLIEKEDHIKNVTNTFAQMRQTIAILCEEIKTNTCTDKNEYVTTFAEKVLKVLDNDFKLNSLTVFDNIINYLETKHQNELTALSDQYSKLQEHVQLITQELNSVNESLLQMKYQLSSKENEYNLLKAQKERVHEISNAVTLDIIRKEQELHETLVEGCKKLMENNIICFDNINSSLPLKKRVQILFERIISDCGPKVNVVEKQNLLLEIKKSKSDIEENQKALEILTIENKKLLETNDSLTKNLKHVEENLQLQMNSQSDLQTAYDIKIEENKAAMMNIEEISKQLNELKAELNKKESIISEVEANKKYLNDKDAKITELLSMVDNYKEEIRKIKSIHEIIIKENEVCATELEECKKTIEANKKLLDKMTFDIITLNESVKESSTTIDDLKMELNNQLQQTTQLKGQIEEKTRYCTRLEMNIKTHEKTAEIQSKMIIRLQKQKEDDDKNISSNNSQISKLTQENSDLQKDIEAMKANVNSLKEEIEVYKSAKETLEIRISELEYDLGNAHKPRTSIEAIADSIRRRRQSVHDSRRTFVENSGDHNKIEAVFDTRSKPADLFMDVDEDSSNRSTPLRSSRGRDSLLSRHEQSENDEDHSRPSSVAAIRRRRQSMHDLHRAGIVQTPSPHGHERPGSIQSDSSPRKSLEADNHNIQRELTELRETLTKCQQEMEELKKQNMELDEECETCSQYLREREAQCLRLKKEKTALENIVADLKNKLQSLNPNRSQQEPKPTYADASANTDEDWTNLHSVVVDRMSFDAEVEKNKRLTKTVEELRFKKQELKNTLGKMQKALERNASKDYNREMEAAKSELKACKQELKDLKEKFSDLGNKYDSCAQYLRERDEQYRKLKETRNALEAKLQEYQEDSNKITHSLRKKRQSFYDQNRCPEVDVTDASTEICEDFLSCQVERDDTKHSNEVRQLNSVIEKLVQQKEALKQKLATAAPNPMYIATGSAIVQNQQITDVLKENQKLKKVNAKLVQICKKRGKQSDIENRDISEQA